MRQLLLFTCILFGVSAHAQQTIASQHPQRWLKQGQEMYINHVMGAALDFTSHYAQNATDEQRIAQQDFLSLAAHFKLQHPRAGENIKTYLQNNPATPYSERYHLFVAEDYFNQRQWDNAQLWYDKVDLDVLNSEEHADYLFRTAYIALQKNNLDVARQKLNDLSANYSKYDEATLFYLAYIDMRQGSYGKATKIFKQYAAYTEYRQEAQMYAAQNYYLQKNYTDAVTAAQNFLKENPDSPYLQSIYGILGGSYFGNRDYPQAEHYLERYFLNNPNLTDNDTFHLAFTYMNLGKFVLANQLLAPLVVKTDATGNAATLLAAHNYASLADTVAAVTAFEKAAASPDTTVSQSALYNLILLLNPTSQQEWKDKIDRFQYFFDTYPRSEYTASLENEFAITLIEAPSHQAALDIIKKQTKITSSLNTAKQIVLYQIGVDNINQQHYESANLYFTESIETHPDSVFALNYLWRAESLYKLGEYSRATEDFKNFLLTSPSTRDRLQALYGLGYTYFKQARYPEAEAEFRKYVSAPVAYPADVYENFANDAWLRIADCRGMQGSTKEAQAIYDSIAKYGKDNAAVYANLQNARLMNANFEYAKALKLLNTTTDSQPSTVYLADLLMEKKNAYTGLKLDNEARATLKELLEGNFDNAVRQEAGMQLALMYVAAGDTVAAKQTYNSVKIIDPLSEEGAFAETQIQNLLLAEGNIKAMVENLPEEQKDTQTFEIISGLLQDYETDSVKANKLLQDYIAQFPGGKNIAEAHYELALLEYYKEDSERNLQYIINELDQAIAGNTKNIISALEIAGETAYKLKDYQKAFNYGEQLLYLNHDKESNQLAYLNMIRCAYPLQNYYQLINLADNLSSSPQPEAEMVMEANLFKGKAYYALKTYDHALETLLKVDSEVKYIFGAEAQYWIAQIYFDTKKYDKVVSLIEKMNMDTSYKYWLGRTWLVYADTQQAQGNTANAKSDLLELKQMNWAQQYPELLEMADQRLAKIEYNF